ncbi:unnamed protein product, partial [Sphacelaria rigidula]
MDAAGRTRSIEHAGVPGSGTISVQAVLGNAGPESTDSEAQTPSRRVHAFKRIPQAGDLVEVAHQRSNPVRQDVSVQLHWHHIIWQMQDPRSWQSVETRDSLIHELANVSSTLIGKFQGKAGEVARLLQGQFLAPHMDRRYIDDHFRNKGFPQMQALLQIVDSGVPVDVSGTGNLDEALRYGNHASAVGHDEEVSQLIFEEIRLGRILIAHKAMAHRVHNLRISPLAYITSPSKSRLILDLSFGEGGNNEDPSGVNGDTNFAAAPGVRLGEILPRVLERVCGLRQKFGPNSPILIAKMDVKAAYRQLQVELDKAAMLSYVFRDYICVDFRVPFGWRSSSGWWSIPASAIAWSHNHTCPDSALILPQALTIAKDIKSAISDHLRMLGFQRSINSPVLSAKKLTDWDTVMEVLGFSIDTQSMRMSIPQRKISEMQELFAEWPQSRNTASVREVLSLAGKLRHFCNVVRAGKFFVWRLTKMTGLDHRRFEDFNAPLRHGSRRVQIKAEFHADLNWW